MTQNDIDTFADHVFIDQKRSRERKTCIVCKKRRNDDITRPLCSICYDEVVKDFPEKYFSKHNAFDDFCNNFDTTYRMYNAQRGYLTIEIPLPFNAPFTVIDVEATGDMHKDKRFFVITTGILHNSKAQIYQLIDFSKKKAFAKECKRIGEESPRPLVAYTYYSERNWLNIRRGGWIDIQRYEIQQTNKGSLFARPLKLNDVSFEWDDISGNDVVEEAERYQTSHNPIHLKRIAYHNFIDLLREYLLALQDIKVQDYLHGKIWDYETNVLKTRHTCPKCYKDFYTKKELREHVSSTHRKRKKSKKSKND